MYFVYLDMKNVEIPLQVTEEVEDTISMIDIFIEMAEQVLIYIEPTNNYESSNA
tara:strand:- start:1130 stop:1291 length:162 start_codon:yes stop_codon:yes gene_type:complete